MLGGVPFDEILEGTHQLAEQNGQFFLLGFIERGEKLRKRLFKGGDGSVVELGSLIRQHDMYNPAVMGVPLPNHQPLFTQTVNDSRKIAHRHHHLRPDLIEGHAPGETNGGQYVKLRGGKSQFFKVFLKFLVGDEAKAQEANPKAGAVPIKKRPLVNGHKHKL